LRFICGIAQHSGDPANLARPVGHDQPTLWGFVHRRVHRRHEATSQTEPVAPTNGRRRTARGQEAVGASGYSGEAAVRMASDEFGCGTEEGTGAGHDWFELECAQDRPSRCRRGGHSRQPAVALDVLDRASERI
jgi:hypothetical protein